MNTVSARTLAVALAALYKAKDDPNFAFPYLDALDALIDVKLALDRARTPVTTTKDAQS